MFGLGGDTRSIKPAIINNISTFTTLELVCIEWCGLAEKIPSLPGDSTSFNQADNFLATSPDCGGHAARGRGLPPTQKASSFGLSTHFNQREEKGPINTPFPGTDSLPKKE